MRGSYPELALAPRRNPADWYEAYVQTCLERDVRSIRQVGDLVQFQSFLRMLAARSGQLLDLSGLSRDLGVAVNTVKAWLSVLEASHQVLILRPYFENIGKRLVKSPKVYLTDTGLLCHLTGFASPDQAAAGPLAGPIFETAVVTEVYRAISHRGESPRLHFWRTSTGEEVDLLVDLGTRLVPVEAKANATPHPRMAEGIVALRRDLGERRVAPSYVVHAGGHRLPLGKGVLAVPISDL